MVEAVLIYATIALVFLVALVTILILWDIAQYL